MVGARRWMCYTGDTLDSCQHASRSRIRAALPSAPLAGPAMLSPDLALMVIRLRPASSTSISDAGVLPAKTRATHHPALSVESRTGRDRLQRGLLSSGFDSSRDVPIPKLGVRMRNSPPFRDKRWLLRGPINHYPSTINHYPSTTYRLPYSVTLVSLAFTVNGLVICTGLIV